MKPTELKQEYIRLRGEGRSYNFIAKQLHISKSTCTKWEQNLSSEIDKLKRTKIDELYESYCMTKQARIMKLGNTLNKINQALEQTDFSEVEPTKLLNFKLKYTEALQKEYIGAEPAFKSDKDIEASDIVTAIKNLLNRVRTGEMTMEQAQKESDILSKLLKAYETVEIETKVKELEKEVFGSD